MKRLYILSIIAFLGSYSINSFGQCTITATPVTATVNCGEEVEIIAQGTTTAPVLMEDFNSGALGPGWTTTQSLIYSNPCGPTLDGTPAGWMGSTATQPRKISTVGFDLQCGAEICFELDFAGDENTTDCEDPDASNEGVYFRYSINGGTTWVDIFYFQPNSANTGPYYSWANYCFDLPAAGFSSSTMFQWSQDAGSSDFWDHWGLDNIIITPYDCGNNYYFEVNGSPMDGDTLVYPTTPAGVTTDVVYDIIYTNGIDDTCSTQTIVTVNPFVVDITAVDPILDCGECTDLNAVLNPLPNINGANYTITWTPAASLSNDAIPNPTACPDANETYTATIIETNSGCEGSETIDIVMNNGSATADFTASVTQGCAPLAVNFTNNSIADSYVWNFGDGSPTTTATDPSHTFTSQGTYTVTLTASLDAPSCLDDVMTIDIIVGNNIQPVADFDYVLECGVPTINITNTSTAGLNYTWNMGDGTTYNTTDVIHAYASTGTYTITLTVDDPICGTSDQLIEVINVVDNPITFIFNEPTCYGFNDGSATIGLTNSTGSEVFTITDSLGNVLNVQGSNTANSLVAGEYTLSVNLGLGCIADTTVMLENPDQIDVTLDIQNVLCNGDATGYAVVTGLTGAQTSTGGVLAVQNGIYNWNPNPAGVGGIGADSSFNMPAGQYTLIVNDEKGCSETFDFVITQPSPIVLSELGSTPAMCRSFYYQNGNGAIWVAASGGVPDYDYLWLNLQDSTVSGNTTWGGLNPGQYQILVQDNNGCTLIQTITLDSLSPIADFEMTSPQFTVDYEGTAPVVVHFENTSTGFSNGLDPLADTTCYWNFGFDPNAWVLSTSIYESFDTTYSEGGEYEVCLVAINKNNCVDTTCKIIIVYDPLQFSPINVFTPNGDGDNDEFTFVYRADAVSEFKCTVVNRWGKTVVEFDNITDTWDGTDKSGSKVTDGVYFYVYEGVADNGTLFSGQGTVTIVGSK
ncbi:MAG: PKD domain-containing protein [Crocinitomicaceae bacterium]|nr:PKD domain-containing protein [Crocinitomicaceae bacterium]